MSDTYEVSHQFEAVVTPGGFGSEIRIDGQAIPMVRSFSAFADTDGAGLTIEVLPEALLSGEVRSLRLFSRVFVVTDVDNQPVQSFGSASAAHSYISKNALVAHVTEVPFECDARLE